MKIVRNSKRPPAVHPPTTKEELAEEARIGGDDATFLSAVAAAGGEVVAETEETVTITVPRPGKQNALAAAEPGKQMLLFAPWFDKAHNRTLITADLLTRYVFTKKRDLKTAKGSSRTFTGKTGQSTIKAAIVEEKIIFPGALEQLIELILRKMTVDQRAEIGLFQEKKSPTSHRVNVTFTLAELRRRMAENGTGRPLTEIREAIEVLSNCNWTVEAPLNPRFVGELRGPILQIGKVIRAKRGDAKGEKTVYEAFWHPLIAESILAADHYLLDAGITRLKDPLSRWMLNRLNARYRQAGKGDAVEGRGYTLSLETILAESGISAESRLRNTIDRVRSSLDELKEHGFLSIIRPYEEQPTYEATARRPKVVAMTWILYPSGEFAQTVIEGNRERRLRGTGEE